MCRSTKYHRDDVKRTGWTEPSPPPPSARGCGRRRRFVRSVRVKFCHHHDESTAALARGFVPPKHDDVATARENPPRAVIMDRRGWGKRPRDDDVDRAPPESFSPASFDWEVRVSASNPRRRAGR